MGEALTLRTELKTTMQDFLEDRLQVSISQHKRVLIYMGKEPSETVY